MPFANLKEAFAKVLEMANTGDAFCQYTIGNSYFWGDFIDIDGIKVLFNDGWALVRASNTGPNLTLRFEAKTNNRLNEIKKEFENLVNKLV